METMKASVVPATTTTTTTTTTATAAAAAAAALRDAQPTESEHGRPRVVPVTIVETRTTVTAHCGATRRIREVAGKTAMFLFVTVSHCAVSNQYYVCRNKTRMRVIAASPYRHATHYICCIGLGWPSHMYIFICIYVSRLCVSCTPIASRILV